MPSDNEYLTYILELLREVDGITFKKMMGEFMLYKNGTIFGGIYDNRFLVKKSKSLESSSLKEQIPYPGEKAMLLVDSENPNEIKDLVELLYEDLAKK